MSSGYTEETKRLYGVLEIRLQDRDWLAGPGRGKFSLADFNVIAWIRFHKIAGIESLDEWPRVKVRDNNVDLLRGMILREACLGLGGRGGGSPWRPGWYPGSVITYCSVHRSDEICTTSWRNRNVNSGL